MAWLVNMFVTLQSLTSLTFNSPIVFWLAPTAGIIAIVSSLLLMRKIGKMSPGAPKAVEVANHKYRLNKFKYCQ